MKLHLVVVWICLAMMLYLAFGRQHTIVAMQRMLLPNLMRSAHAGDYLVIDSALTLGISSHY